MQNTAIRLIALIMLLQRRLNLKAAELTELLSVSMRTVLRYVCLRDEMGIPIYRERVPGGGSSMVRGYKMPSLAFAPEEAVAVRLGASLVGGMWGHTVTKRREYAWEASGKPSLKADHTGEK
jgi:predicted DNA-binding transcriptional regulator YafY